MPEQRDFDLIVVGSGAAGLSAALRAAELGATVAVVTAGAVLAGSSPRAQGGVAAALGADDAPALHAADTLSVGAGLNDATAVDLLTREARSSVQWLLDAGVGFEHDLGLEAGHARRRILHAGGGATGQVLSRALVDRARMHRLISIFEQAPVWTLDRQSERILGVRVGRRRFRGRASVIAAGGYAALWGRSTNAPETRGTGLFLAWQAGASLADLEFVQFHPTALSLADRPAFLLSEALRGEGARLVDERGAEVVDALLPRDVLARALHRHGRVFLSLQHLDPSYVYGRFTRLADALRDFGLDLAHDPLPVAPAAHYCMGGVRTDTWGRTDVAGLYAAGEVACSGVQGANRLASNSLLECLVFGARAAEAALTDAPDTVARWRTASLAHGVKLSPRHTVIAAIDPNALGSRLDADVGVERSGDRLQRLVNELPHPDTATSSDLLLASLISRAALLRRESRGAHFRADAPDADPTWRGRIHWRRGRPPVFEEVSP
jgi:L-aspartate oxidase